MFKVSNKDTRTKPIMLSKYWCFYCYFEHISYFFSTVSVADFKQVNVRQVCNASEMFQTKAVVTQKLKEVI